MDIKKLVPWNWFKKEEENAGKPVPVRHSASHETDYSLSHPITRLHHDIDRLFEDAFRGFGFAPFGGGKPLFPQMSGGLLKPTLDLGATDKEYTVTVEIPGVDDKDIKLEIVNSTLTIRGEKKQEKEENDQNFYRLERSYGSFQRVLSLPEDVDEAGVAAKFTKGVLTITLPRKSMPQSQIRRIEVKRAE